jgi:hypothetical protein
MKPIHEGAWGFGVKATWILDFEELGSRTALSTEKKSPVH